MSWLVFRRVRSSEPTFGEETCPFCHFFIHSFFGVVDDMHLVDAATVVVVVVVVGAFITLFCSSSSSNAVVLILFSRHDSDELEILLISRVNDVHPLGVQVGPSVQSSRDQPGWCHLYFQSPI